MYSRTVQKLVAEMPNSGDLADATHAAVGENPVCGDVVRFQFRIVASRVEACRYRVSGCPAAIASAAALSLVCRGKTVEECLKLDARHVLDLLDGLPAHKLHGPEVALEALRLALSD